MNEIYELEYSNKETIEMPSARTCMNLDGISPFVCTESTHQFKVSGLMVFKFPLCFAQVLQLAFSNLTPFAISFFLFVIAFQLDQTSSSAQP